MEKMIDSYFQHLAANPERLDSLFQWIFCVLAIWFVLWKFRERILKGLAGDGRHPGEVGTDNLDAREIIIFVFLFIAPPTIFNVAFFHNVDTWQIYAMVVGVAPLYYQVFGRFIFDFILAFMGKQKMDTPAGTPPAS